MSPLVRSLLALAALFATAAAAATQQDFPFPQCTTVLIGRESDNERNLPPVHVDWPGAEIDIVNKCGPRPGFDLNGVLVEACNNDLIDGVAPIIIPDERFLKQVGVWCVDDCPYGLTVILTEYCGPVVPPSPPQSRRH